MSAALAVDGVTVSYRGAIAVRDVSFEVQPGEVVALLGSNGAGKTSLAKAVAGLEARIGEVTVGSTVVKNQRPERFRQAGGALVPQGRELFPELTVRDHLVLGTYGRYLSMSKAMGSPALVKAIERFPVLGDMLERQAGLLSGGQQQMLAVARALVGEPALIVVDEPSLGLAPIITDGLYDEFASLRDSGISLLIIEESPQRALKLADRALVMERGQIAEELNLQGHAEHVMKRLEGRYLGIS
jgi:branched-chain amino acid transport system ATP-binding protein